MIVYFPHSYNFLRFLLLNVDHPHVGKLARTVGSTHNLYSQDSFNHNECKQVENQIHVSKSRKRPCEENCSSDNPTKGVAHHQTIWKPENDSDQADVMEATCSRAENQLKDNVESTAETLEAEIDEILQGRPKYVPTNHNSGVLSSNIETSKSFSAKSLSRGKARVRLSRPTTSSLARSSHLAIRGGGNPSRHHGFVHMIGGALSIIHGNVVNSNRTPVHHPQSKPRSLVSGDSQPQQYRVPIVNSVMCSCRENEGLYQLPCGHVVCRKCMLHKMADVTNVECIVCRKSCKRSEVFKYHEKSIFS